MNQPLLRKIGLGLLLFAGLWLLCRYLLPILLPFLLASLLAFSAEPLVSFLHDRIRLPRALASGIGVSIALLLAVLLVLTLCALLLRQLGNLSGVLPDLGQTAQEGMESLEGFLVNLAQKTPQTVSPILTRGVENFFSDSTQLVDQITAKVLALASGILTRIPDSALGFGTWILASFMISAKLPNIRTWVSQKLPDSWRQQYLPAVKRLKRSLSGWLTAQLKLTGITFSILCGGFLLLRIHHAPLWAMLISLVDALPILGTGTVLVPWSLVCFLQGDHVRSLGLLGIYAAAALLRSVLEPKFIGKQLGLDPLVTLLSMYTGYRLWGILGMLISPLLAVTVTQLALQTKR